MEDLNGEIIKAHPDLFVIFYFKSADLRRRQGFARPD